MREALLRRAYTGLWYLLTPFVLAHLAWRARRQPEYLRHVGERFGRYASSTEALPALWIHAVSVGETRAAEPLIRALALRHPDLHLVITHTTPTGRAVELRLPAPATRLYLPYDYPFAVKAFLRHFRPRLAVLMETEVWPNLIAEASRAGTPLALVNARLSARSLRRGKRYAALMQGAVRRLDLILAQTDEDRARMEQIGARNVQVVGNLKFDMEVPQELLALAERFKASYAHRAVCLAASTREGEEALILEAWQKARPPDALLLIVPRHPQRFDEVAAQARERGFSVERRSTDARAISADVLLGDSMGEMLAYYASADVAYVGGGLLPFGTHNLIEACAVGCPVLLGPHTFNFAEAARLAMDAGAALQIDNARALVETFGRLLNEPQVLARMRAAGITFAQTHRGATRRTLASLETLLPSAAAER